MNKFEIGILDQKDFRYKFSNEEIKVSRRDLSLILCH